MKLEITKRRDGNIEFELNTAPDKKSQTITVEPDQLDLLVKIINTARDATTFVFALEL